MTIGYIFTSTFKYKLGSVFERLCVFTAFIKHGLEVMSFVILEKYLLSIIMLESRY